MKRLAQAVLFAVLLASLAVALPDEAQAQTYNWSTVYFGGDEVDFRLDSIDYTSNGNASLPPHARIEFDYAPLQSCGGG